MSYTANVSDSDGNVTELNLTVYDDGSQVFHDSQSFSSSSVEYTWSDVYQPTEGELNARFTATDDAGATTKTWLNRTLQDNAPAVTVNKPKNQTYWDYDRNWDISVTDNDDKPDEQISCDLTNASTTFDTVTGTESFTETGTFRARLGTHTFEASCTDPAGNTGTVSQTFTVQAVQLYQANSDSPVYETENVSYSVPVHVGDMVQELNANLTWNGTVRRHDHIEPSIIENVTVQRKWPTPLITQNQTTETWYWDIQTNISDFSSGYQQLDRQTSDQSQELWIAYFADSFNLKQSDVVEATTVNASFNAYSELSFPPATLNASITYNGTTKTGVDTAFYAPVIANNSALTVSTSGSGAATWSFRDRSKTLTTSSDTVTVHDKRLTNCTAASASQEEALTFVVRNEENRTNLIKNNTVAYNFDTTVAGRNVDNFAFRRSGQKRYDTCIYPTWAQYQITGPVQYDGDGFTDRSYSFYKAPISNQTSTVDLYLLPNDVGTPVYFDVEYSDGSAVNDATIKVLRYFTGLNSYITVTKTETDSNGVASTFLHVNDIYYKYLVIKDGRVLKETNRQILTCQTTPCTKKLVVDKDDSEYFKYQDGFSYNCDINQPDGNASLQCTVDHSSGTFTRSQLLVEQSQPIGSIQTCNTTISSSGSMVCNLGNLTEKHYTYVLTGSKAGFTYTLLTGTAGQNTSPYPDAGATLFAFLIFITITGLGIKTPTTTIIMAVLGVFASLWMQLYAVSAGALAGLAVAAVIAFLEVNE